MEKSLLAGLLQGFGASLQQNQQNKREQEMLDMQKEAFKRKQKADEAEYDLMLKKQGLIEQILGQSGQQQGAFTPGQTEAQQPGIADKMAGLQMDGISPMQAVALKEATGMDFPKAIQMGQDVDEFNAIQDYRGKLLDYRDREMVPVTITNQDGSQSIIMRPKYAQSALQQPEQFIQTKPQIGDMPISEQNIPLWVHPDTLEPAPYGITPNEAKNSGFVRIDSNTKTKINDFRALDPLLNNIENLMEKVFPKEEGALGRVVGGPKRTFGAITQIDPDAKLLKSTIDGTMSALIRMFEKGTLTDQDIKRAKALMIELSDSGDVAWNKINNLRNFIRDVQGSFISGGGEKQPKRKQKGKPKTAAEYLQQKGF